MVHPPRPSAPPAEESAPIARKPPADPPPPKANAPKAKAPRKRADPRAPVAATKLPATPGTPRKKAAAAGPATAARRTKRAEPSALDRMQAVILASLDADKAENVVTIDMEGRASFADRMVVATGIADRQITAMAQHLEEKLHEAGLKRVLVEGAAGSDWVLIDAGDIVVHLFKPDARTLYGLEKMWGAELDETPAGPDSPA